MTNYKRILQSCGKFEEFIKSGIKQIIIEINAIAFKLNRF